MTEKTNGKEEDGAGRTEESSPDPPSDSPSAFERFEQFARKVISVPKATIDERERTYREQRKMAKDEKP